MATRESGARARGACTEAAPRRLLVMSTQLVRQIIMRISYLALALASVSAACEGSARARDSVAIMRDSSAAPSDTAYQAGLAKYRRDAARIDSLTSAARRDPILRTDSLYRVYRLAVRPNGLSVGDVQLLACLESALSLRYGRAASQRILKELRDTVFRDVGKRDGLEFFLGRAPDKGVLDSSRCAPEPNVRPYALSGTQLDDEPRPPQLRP